MEALINLLICPLKWVYLKITLIQRVKRVKKHIIELLEIIDRKDIGEFYYIFGVILNVESGEELFAEDSSEDAEMIFTAALYKLSEKYQLTLEEKKKIIDILKNTTPNIIYEIYNKFRGGSQFYFLVRKKNSGEIIHKEVYSRHIPMLTSPLNIERYISAIKTGAFDKLIKKYLS